MTTRPPLVREAAEEGAARHADALRLLVGERHVLVGPDLPGRYTQDLWGSDRVGVAGVVVRPGTAEEVAMVLRYCHAHGQPVVVQGGMTGLVSGGVPGAGEVVLSTERLTELGAVDPVAGTVTAGAGVTLADLQQHAAPHGLTVPIDLASKDSATIGGCVATNAGGVNVVGYGMTRRHVRSLQVVLADGTLLDLSTDLVKDNAGYDLKQLFIGSEGTLGVVTAATLALHPAPQGRTGAFCAVADVDGALKVLGTLRERMPGSLTSFEVIWADAYAVLEGTGVRLPLPQGHPLYILAECETSRPDDADVFVACLEELSDTLADTAVATSPADLKAFWRARERIPGEVLRMQPLFGFDVSVPAGSLAASLEEMRAELRRQWPGVRLLVFGHLGDDNVHIAVATGEKTRERKADVEHIVYRTVSSCGGSISAEHGVGFEKREYLGYTRSAGEIELMRTLKTALDPGGILGRGRVLPWTADGDDGTGGTGLTGGNGGNNGGSGNGGAAR
ncbi:MULTISPECIES: FAD-binding oxidoreductase [Streptomyces]|uniref:FAD-binding oxidoreductase n=1 Tax=Streptomyces lycii TaxID=2654337 RepID=A0ABQ7FL39_9ACTN|nr:FAD-binding oxidoreductase [Streptomyces lycii]KAF4409545.1 FAD-binding oxidoreductase [Streptomyces lycii]